MRRSPATASVGDRRHLLPPPNHPIHRVVSEKPPKCANDDREELRPPTGEKEGRDCVIRDGADCTRQIELEEAKESRDSLEPCVGEFPHVIEDEVEDDSGLNRSNE